VIENRRKHPALSSHQCKEVDAVVLL
jgi:hypothetical protein